MPRAFSESERERIRDNLIGVGKRLLNKAGMRLLVVDDIAREAGISKGSFYSFYPSREDFILSVFESWEVEYRGALLREFSESGGTVREKLERFFLGAFQILEREPGLANFGMKDIQIIIDRLPPERIAAHQAADNKVLGETFGHWVEEGFLPPDILPAFRGLVAALFSIALHREDFPAGSYHAAVKLIAEALAMRIAASAGEEGEKR
ncbi:MAG TPA: TetR/AcrR family transcriptional regulator [Rectinemataceae bacterium]|nr:TetR/AcrR family transcriptional regulator [Rectinemataceae bacterium]